MLTLSYATALTSESVSPVMVTASLSSSTSRSSSMYCALDREMSVVLQSFNVENVMPHRVIPLMPAAATLNGTSGAAPIGRAALLRNVPLGANLSSPLRGTIRGDPEDAAWVLVHVTVDVQSRSSLLPSQTVVIPFTQVFTGVVSRWQSLVVLVGAPNATAPPRWLPASLSTFRDVTLVFYLSLRCPMDNLVTATVRVDVPCRGEVQPLASDVTTVETVALYLSAFSVPATGGAVGRVTSVRRLVLCSDSTVIEGLLPLVFDFCGNDEQVVVLSARGGILGNFVMWAAASALITLAVTAFARIGPRSLRVSAEVLGVPSPLLPLVVVTVPATVSSTLYLLHARSCTPDGIVAAVGIVMSLCPIAVLSFVAYEVPRRLSLVNHQKTKLHTRNRLWLLTYLAFRRQKRWRDLRTMQSVARASYEQNSAYTWLRATTVLLLEYASVWYACVDVAVLTASCMIGALGILESASACRGGVIAILVLYVAQLVLCAVVWPFATMFSHVYALFTLALSSVAVACQVWYLSDSTADNADLDALNRLLTAAAVCDLSVCGVSMLKTIMDLIDAARACCRHLCGALATSATIPRTALDHSLTPSNVDCPLLIDSAQLAIDGDDSTELLLTDVSNSKSEDERNVISLAIVEDDFDALILDVRGDEVSVGIFTASESTLLEINDLTRMYGKA